MRVGFDVAREIGDTPGAAGAEGTLPVMLVPLDNAVRGRIQRAARAGQHEAVLGEMARFEWTRPEDVAGRALLLDRYEQATGNAAGRLRFLREYAEVAYEHAALADAGDVHRTRALRNLLAVTLELGAHDTRLRDQLLSADVDLELPRQWQRVTSRQSRLYQALGLDTLGLGGDWETPTPVEQFLPWQPGPGSESHAELARANAIGNLVRDAESGSPMQNMSYVAERVSSGWREAYNALVVQAMAEFPEEVFDLFVQAPALPGDAIAAHRRKGVVDELSRTQGLSALAATLSTEDLFRVGGAFTKLASGPGTVDAVELLLGVLAAKPSKPSKRAWLATQVAACQGPWCGACGEPLTVIPTDLVTSGAAGVGQGRTTDFELRCRPCRRQGARQATSARAAMAKPRELVGG